MYQTSGELHRGHCVAMRGWTVLVDEFLGIEVDLKLKVAVFFKISETGKVPVRAL